MRRMLNRSILALAMSTFYLFFEIDIAIWRSNSSRDDIALAVAQDVMFRLGRRLSGYWEPTVRPDIVPQSRVRYATTAHGRDVDLRQSGKISDAGMRRTCAARLRRIGSIHAAAASAAPLGSSGTLRYKHLEYDRMPQMAFWR